MNNKVKFLEIVLSDLVSQRDTAEMDLNFVLNSDNNKTENKKTEFISVLDEIVNINNKIQTLSEYLAQINAASVANEVVTEKE